MVKNWNYLIKLARIVITIILVIAFVDIANFTAGNRSYFAYTHPFITYAIYACIIMELILIPLIFLELISKRNWKKMSILSMLTITFLIVYGLWLDRSAQIGSVNANKTVKQLFMSGGSAFPVIVEKDAEYDYVMFISKYNDSAIKEVISWPLIGRYKYVVVSEGIKPFTIVMQRLSHGCEFWVHKYGVEYDLRRIKP